MSTVPKVKRRVVPTLIVDSESEDEVVVSRKVKKNAPSFFVEDMAPLHKSRVKHKKRDLPQFAVDDFLPMIKDVPEAVLAPVHKRKTKGNIESALGEASTHYKEHVATLYEKDAVDEIVKRAVRLGYETQRGGDNIRRGLQKRGSDDAHGNHHLALANFNDYVKHFASMKTHSRGVSMLQYLQKNFDKGMYFSSKTKRFRRKR
jgi:hypothetical protein